MEKNQEKIIVNIFMVMPWRKPLKYYSEAKAIQGRLNSSVGWAADF